MARDNFEKLIERYADGRQICNCRNAYYTNCGHAIVGDRETFDHPVCQYGCSAAQIDAKKYVANQVVEEFLLADLTEDQE